MVEIVDKYFKTTLLVPKKWQKLQKKVKKMMYEWDVNMNKGIEIIKRNKKEVLDGTEKYNNWNKNPLERFEGTFEQALFIQSQ